MRRDTRVSAWAAAFVPPEGEADDTVIEGEIVDEEPSPTAAHVDYVTAAYAQAGGLLQILVGFALANSGVATLPLGIALVAIGLWLMLRGIRQAKNSVQNATRAK